MQYSNDFQLEQLEEFSDYIYLDSRRYNSINNGDQI